MNDGTQRPLRRFSLTMKIFHGFTILAFFLLTGLLLLLFVPFRTPGRLDGFIPLRQGNEWTYLVEFEGKSSTAEIRIESEETKAGMRIFRVLYPAIKYDYVVFDSEGLKVLKEEFFSEGINKIYDKPKIILPNMRIGESKAALLRVKIQNIAGGDDVLEGTIDYHITRGGAETIEVSAGRFNGCLRFDSFLEWKASDGEYGTKKYTFWLAKGVGLVRCAYESKKFSKEGKMRYSRNKNFMLMKYKVVRLEPRESVRR
jgi:hypothetical protein